MYESRSIKLHGKHSNCSTLVDMYDYVGLRKFNWFMLFELKSFLVSLLV